MPGRRVLCGFLALLAALIPGTAAEQRRQLSTQPARFRVSSDLVVVNATVLDPAGRPITGLRPDCFRLFEQRAEQRIAFFSEQEAPVSLMLVADTSGSMKGKLDVCARAAAELVRTVLPGDQFALVTFADEPRLAVPWTGEGAAIERALSREEAYGSTALFDAVLFAAQYCRRARNARRVLLVVSDGGDNHSRYSRGELLRRLDESGIEVYAVNLAESWFSNPLGEALPGAALDVLCARASGRNVIVDAVSGLPEAINRISREIRSQYLLGYYPERKGAGRQHRVEVKVNPPPGTRRVSVYWRQAWREPD